MQDRSGEVVRDYRLLEFAGKGAFAAVYRAEHERLKRIRAVKVIHPEHLQDKDALRRFTAEAQVVSRLEHAHIVTLYEFWVDDRGAYIVMRWMPQGNLEQYIKRVGPITPANVAQMLGQIAPALSLVHQNNIVHRDLKPANMLFDENDEIQLADFGLAKWLQEAPTTGSADETVGTPAYMAPEQANPKPGVEISPQADIYSLGVILYEMLTGKHPFGEAGVVGMMLHHLRDPLPSLHDHNPDIPEALDAVIQKATAKSPAERYPDVLALADAFREVAAPTREDDYLVNTSIIAPREVKAAGDLNARIYTRSGAVLENPRRLIGRDDQVDLILQLLDGQSHVLLHGMAGIGKTALAGRIAAQYLETGSRKVVWIELGRQSADTFFETLARALGQHQQIASKRGLDRLLAVREMLLDQDLLIVIDNIWNEAAVLPIIRAVPHTMPMLMTSRTAISVDGAMISVESLAETAALDLLNEVALQHYVAESDAAKLCDLLGNHPYAIEIAATRLKTYRTLTPERLIADIQDAHRTLVITGTLGIGQQKSIKDLLDESVHELSPELRQALVMMGGLYSSRASIELFALLLGQDEKTTEAQLTELERLGLARIFIDGDVPAHYRLHDLTYGYAYNLFKAGGGDVQDVIKAAQGFVKKNVQDYDKLEFDLLNILGGARRAYQEGANAQLISIMKMLAYDGSYLLSNGATEEAIRLLEAAIARAEAAENYHDAHYISGRLGDIHRAFTFRFDRAEAAYRRAIDFAREMKDLGREATILSLLGVTMFLVGEDDPTMVFEAAYAVAQKSKDPDVFAAILSRRSFYEGQKSPPDYAASWRFANKAVEIARQFDLKEHLIASLMNRANCERALGRLQDALGTDREAYETSVQFQNTYLQAYSAHSVADDLVALERNQESVEMYKEALSLYHKLGLENEITEIQDALAKQAL